MKERKFEALKPNQPVIIKLDKETYFGKVLGKQYRGPNLTDEKQSFYIVQWTGMNKPETDGWSASLLHRTLIHPYEGESND